MSDIQDRINRTNFLVEKRISLQRQISMLEQELRNVGIIINQTCPMSDITHYRSSGYHQSDHWYECNICKQSVSYDIYRQYLRTYNKPDVIVDREW